MSRTSDGYSLALVAFGTRKVTVRRGGAAWRAEALIAGRPAVLRRIFVQTSGSLLGPHVEWVELSGTELGSERVVSERIVNH